MLTVKNNQPTLFDAIEGLFNSKVIVDDVNISFNCGHGRDEKRIIETITIHPSSPITGKLEGIHQVIRITRFTEDHKTYESKKHVVYAICSRSPKKLNASGIAQALRDHWSIEVRLHGQKDVRMGEDANKTFIGSGPRALACLRNWAIAVAEKYQRSENFRRISQAWQCMCYNIEKGVSLML